MFTVWFDVEILLKEVIKIMNEKPTKLLTEREAAEEFFGWSVDKMRQIRKRGEIEYFRFNDQVIKYSIEQLEAYKSRFIKQAA